MKHATTLWAVLTAAALTGCGDGLSKRALGELIDTRLTQQGEPLCWSLQNMNFQWPVRVGFGFGSPAQEPILIGAAEAGVIELQDPNSQLGLGERLVAGRAGQPWTIDLTDKGRKARAWDPEKGLCIGRRRLHEVLRWTEPAAGQAATFTQVTYTWKIQDTPKWVEPDHFASIEGMVEPVESSITLVKTSDGWQAEY